MIDDDTLDRAISSLPLEEPPAGSTAASWPLRCTGRVPQRWAGKCG